MLGRRLIALAVAGLASIGIGSPTVPTQIPKIHQAAPRERRSTRSRTTFVWIDPVAGWLCVDAASHGKAEEVIEHLRHCLDEFPIKPLHTQLSPQAAMAPTGSPGYGR